MEAKMKKPFLVLVFLLMILSLACKVPNLNRDEENDVEEPTSVIEVQPTAEEILNPTETYYSPPTARPTIEKKSTPEPTMEEQKPTETATQPVTSCAPFMKEEFENPNECWPSSLDTIFSVAGISNENKVNVQVKNGLLEFESQLSEDVFLYSFYKDNEYDEVILQASITKIEPSVNRNGFALACHVNQDGWYEARIESSGAFEINQYDAFKKRNGENPYVRMGNGGAAAFRVGTGRENIIEWQCGDDQLRLIVNGKMTWEKENITGMNSGGGVGVGLASYSGIYPRHIGFEYVEILEP
jgi:hypothetical protein